MTANAALRGLGVLAALAASLPALASADDTVKACIGASTDGQTYRLAGQLLAARESFIACSRDACPPIVRSHCARWLSEVEAALPGLVVRAQNTRGEDAVDAHLTIDGKPAKLDGQPVRLDPGEHVLVLSGASGARAEQRVLLVEGERARRVTLRLPGSAADTRTSAVEGSPWGRVPAGAWILGGAGLVSLGVATYFGLAAQSQLTQLQASCSPHCTDAQTQPGRTDALAFDVLLGVGGAALAGSIVWVLAFPSSSGSAWAPRLEVHPVAGGALTSLGAAF